MSRLNAQQILADVAAANLRTDRPQMNAGDTVKVFARIVEGGKERIQAYEGVVIKLQGTGISKTVTVRRIFQGVGVERVFPIHSPRIDRIEVLRRGDVRRARIYYLRGLQGKAARIKEKARDSKPVAPKKAPEPATV
ncbi:MAG: 50S ribosomal protein L19 [Candidatus Sericytochromatia bacterium]|nr:50S ribosomal protein L19 [Candidatus Sericytochromatia bacterium]